MITLLRYVIGASVLLLATAASANEFADFSDALLGRQIKNDEVVGATIVIVEGDRIGFLKGYGLAERETARPVDPTKTLFRPGSTSKLLTWTALMQLVEAGHVNLDAPVEQYIDFRIRNPFPEPVRVRHLLTHTAGFEDIYLGLFVQRPNQLVELSRFVRDHQPAIVRAPGTEAAYSNYGTALAGYIIERVSGESFETYLQQKLLQPLGMSRTTFRQPLPADRASDVAAGYAVVDGQFRRRAFELVNGAPAGGASTTAADMGRFTIAHLNPGTPFSERMLKAQTLTTMQSRRFAHHPALPGFALGFYELRAARPRVIAHFGNTDDFRSALVLVPERKLGAFVSYTGGPGSHAARTAYINSFLDRFAPAAPERSTHLVPKPDSAYDGVYRPNRRSYTTFEAIFVLGSDVKVRADAQGVETNIDGDVRKWRAIGPDLFEAAIGASRRERLAFGRDASGHVTTLFLGSMPYIAAHRIQWHRSENATYVLLAAASTAFLLAAAAAGWRWRSRPRAAQLFGLGALLNLLFVAGLLLVVVPAASTGTIGSAPPSFHIVFALPVAALVAFLAGLIVWAWSSPRAMSRRWFLAPAVEAVFVLWLWSWNLLGFNFK